LRRLGIGTIENAFAFENDLLFRSGFRSAGGGGFRAYAVFEFESSFLGRAVGGDFSRTFLYAEAIEFRFYGLFARGNFSNSGGRSVFKGSLKRQSVLGYFSLAFEYRSPLYDFVLSFVGSVRRNDGFSRFG